MHPPPLPTLHSGWVTSDGLIKARRDSACKSCLSGASLFAMLDSVFFMGLLLVLGQGVLAMLLFTWRLLVLSLLALVGA